MKVVDDNILLSFEDIQIYDDHLIDSIAAEDEPPLSHNERFQLIARFLHSFLEWDLFDEYMYLSTWELSYTSADTLVNTISVTIKTKTLEEAEKMAVEKVSLFLRTPIHFIQDETMEEEFYMVVDSENVYRGLMEIHPENLV